MYLLSRSFAGLLLVAVCLPAQELKPIALEKPQTDGGKPLMQALKERKSEREFSPEKLSPQMLSNLLWAAWGVNRPDGRRTAPSASNRQEIDVYAITAEGIYLYNAKAHQLEPVAAGDFRAAAGPQPFVAQAPLNLVYVADQAKTKNSEMTYADTGFISQNVYLFCASEGLATVARGSVDRAALAKTLKLRPDQAITLAQTVGYPKK
jgi:SagB-type dehydrogenase family enzyme